MVDMIAALVVATTVTAWRQSLIVLPRTDLRCSDDCFKGRIACRRLKREAYQRLCYSACIVAL